LIGPYTLKIPPVDEIMAESPSELRIEIEKLEQKHAENPGGRYFVPLANAYRKLGAVEHAESLLLDGLRSHPEYLSAHIVLGRCLADRKANAEATEEFRYVLSIDPQNLVALRSLGEIALDQDQPADAAHWFQELISVDPMNEDARRALEQLGTILVADASTSGAPTGSWLEAMDEEMNGLRRSWPAQSAPRTEEADSYETAFAERRDGDYGELAGFEDDYRDQAAPSDAHVEADLLRDDEEDVPGELVTETIAELYARQGFYTRSADVLRELIRRRGGDEALSRRLEEIERMALASQSDAGGSVGIGEQPFALEEAAPRELTFEPAASAEEFGEVSPEPSVQPGEPVPQEAVESTGSEPGSEWQLEEERLTAGLPAIEEQEQEQEQEQGAEGSHDPEDAFAASFTHGFPSQQEEGTGSRASDTVTSGDGDQRWPEDEAGFSLDDESRRVSGSEEARLSGDTAEAGPSETISDYLGSLASWRPGPASQRTSPVVLASGAAPGASQQEPSPPQAESSETATPESGQRSAGEWSPEDSFDAPASPASKDVEQIGGSGHSDPGFPASKPPQAVAAGSEGTGSAAADRFPWEDEQESEPQRPLSEHHAGDDAGVGAVEPGSFEEYLSFDGEPAGAPADPAGHGTTATTPRTGEAPAAPGGAAEDDDDLESFQTWLRSLKR
jgi:tetratricopeptide (TPR) repeat protein